MATPRVIRLAAVRRGVQDLGRSAGFYSWLLGLEAESTVGGIRFACRNGEFALVAEATPVSVGWALDRGPFPVVDPDGVPLMATGVVNSDGASSVALDHVRLNCADLAASVDFYRTFGLALTWTGSSSREETLEGESHAELPPDADWVHLSAVDGYVSLSQADWLDYGVHTAAAGPPRFIHVGLAMETLDPVLSRLEDRRVPHRLLSSPLGRQLYLNDCDGKPEVGYNVELFEYADEVSRSGAAARAWPGRR